MLIGIERTSGNIGRSVFRKTFFIASRTIGTRTNTDAAVTSTKSKVKSANVIHYAAAAENRNALRDD